MIYRKVRSLKRFKEIVAGMPAPWVSKSGTILSVQNLHSDIMFTYIPKGFFERVTAMLYYKWYCNREH